MRCSPVLDGSCRTPIAGHAVLTDGVIYLRGLIAKPDGSELIATERRGDMARCRGDGPRRRPGIDAPRRSGLPLDLTPPAARESRRMRIPAVPRASWPSLLAACESAPVTGRSQMMLVERKRGAPDRRCRPIARCWPGAAVATIRRPMRWSRRSAGASPRPPSGRPATCGSAPHLRWEFQHHRQERAQRLLPARRQGRGLYRPPADHAAPRRASPP